MMQPTQDRSRTRPIELPPRSKGAPSAEAAIRVLGTGAFKAGIAGIVAMTVLMLISLVDIPLLPCLVIPGFISILIANGILAGLLSNERLNSPGQARQAGLLAGLVTGLGATFVAMVLAAFGMMFTGLGEGVRAQFTPAQLQNLAAMGISPQTVRIAGAVFFALLIWGVFGTVIAAALGMLGAHLYYRLR